MSKKILPIPLKMKNGTKVRTIEELRANADIESIVSFYIDGRLDRWCKAFHYDDIPNELADVTEAMIYQVSDALGITFKEEEVDAYLKERNEKIMENTKMANVKEKNDESDEGDCNDIRDELAPFIKDDINLDDYSVKKTLAKDDEDLKVMVLVTNKKKNINCVFFIPMTKTDISNTEKFWFNLYSKIANVMKKIK